MMKVQLSRSFSKLLCAAVIVSLANVVPTVVGETLKTDDYTLSVETFADGLDTPWAVAVIDSGTALVTEKKGTLRKIVDGKLLPDAVTGTPAVNDNGQGGLLDVAIDPDYATNGFVYLAFSDPLGGQASRKTAAMTKIVRGIIADGKWTKQKTLWEAKEADYRQGPVHFGSRIVFDSKGHLFFPIGDRGAQDQAQLLNKPNGKVHRINRDGSVPKDNPFVKTTDAYKSIYTVGNRNSQGLAIHPDTDALWGTEHGPMGGDELNLLQSGKNYGWPIITYGKNYNGTPVGAGITEKEGLEQHVVQWTPSPAMCGLAFVTGDQFPKWKNNLLAGALKSGQVKRLVLDGNKVVSEEIIVKNMGRVRDVRMGPDGAIYVVLNSPGKVIRLTPTQ